MSPLEGREQESPAVEALRQHARYYAPFRPLTEEEVKRGADALIRELGEWGSDRMHAQWARILLGSAVHEVLAAEYEAAPASRETALAGRIAQLEVLVRDGIPLQEAHNNIRLDAPGGILRHVKAITESLAWAERARAVLGAQERE